ncbi:MAG: ABC transporter ATP-binding protein [Clostridiales Family XIII bacterium]|jgi:osmoprotectant transport system ATP-binding protein|nr:ABC transporter ATP-binding protein [Clostridiales Family XIII bacterium]
MGEEVAGKIIEIRGVSKQFKNAQAYAVDHVSIDVSRGDFITIMGTSGSGKTTLLKMINRIHELTDGNIFFEGQNIHDLKVEAYRKKIGYVIQQIGLFPHMTVAENIAVVPKSLHWGKDRIAARASELLSLVHLEPAIYKDRYPSQLSGGQQQRVGLARALAADPEIMLMDEPFGAIDAITRQVLQDELLAIHRKTGKTVLFVTHDLHEAFRLGDKVIIMNEGRVQQYDTPYNILFHPANGYVAKLVASEDIIEKLKVLRADSISTPVQVTPDGRVPRVLANAPLSAVLGKFMETGAPQIYVEDAQGRIEGSILWNSLQSIASLRTEGAEYFV